MMTNNVQMITKINNLIDSKNINQYYYLSLPNKEFNFVLHLFSGVCYNCIFL